MKKESAKNNLSAEMIAAYLDGNATAEECQDMMNAMAEDEGLREMMRISQSVDLEIGDANSSFDLLPMTAMAATHHDSNTCCLECEKYVLQHWKIPFKKEELEQIAIEKKWQTNSGTSLHNVGKLLEHCGLTVTRRYQSSTQEISQALRSQQCVIVAVDGGELLGDKEKERLEDAQQGPQPDHTVVVVDIDDAHITLYDPESPFATDTYPLAYFEDAWEDSQRYMMCIALSKDSPYVAHPIDLSDVSLPEELNDLREAIAENAHEVWAQNRQAEGWTYGPVRNDQLKQTPDMVPYSILPDSEKKYDREMAVNTIKLLRKLGYDIIKRQ